MKNTISKTTKFIFFGIFLVSMGCGSSNTTESSGDISKLKELIESRQFLIENDWATPIQGQQINLLNNPNEIRFSGDSVYVDLPYYGIRHAGGGYQRDGGMNYVGIAENLKIEENSKKERIDLSFEGTQNGENLDFFIRIFLSGKANTNVNSSQRSSINYLGKVESYNNDDRE
ncbi:DUF4251 domain-containing protein [Gramella sp. BOM4]|nr:DUF4251 domain-containing protein [Christiangramia bathymodioli]